MRTLLVMLLAWIGLAPEAHAQWQAKTMRDPLPARRVERPLVLPKGWVELTFGYDRHVGQGRWTRDGTVERFEHASWVHQTGSLRLAYGISKHAELWWRIPFHQATLANDRWPDDVTISDTSLGDQYFGWKLDLLRTEAPASQLALETWYKAPTAKESPAGYIGGPLNVQSLVFTTGTPDWYVGGGYKRQLGPLALTAELGWLHRFGGVVQYLIELENFQFNGRIKPGDQLRAQLDLMAQIGPVAVGANPRYELRLPTRVGTSAKGLFPSKDLEAVADSAGDALDLRLWAMFDLTRGFGLGGYFVQPVMGEDLLFFPIEDLNPTWGPTFGGTVEARF